MPYVKTFSTLLTLVLQYGQTVKLCDRGSCPHSWHRQMWLHGFRTVLRCSSLHSRHMAQCVPL